VLRRALLAALVISISLLEPRSLLAWAEEEFAGPFPTWVDARQDYRAVGDGKADDTEALQNALDAIVTHRRGSVLYIPAGTYRITRALTVRRKVHGDGMAITLVGEDPATTTLVWDGEQGGTLLEWDAWYSKISRLTLDGAGRAGQMLRYGPAFSTYNETSDLTFRDADCGLVFGEPATAGQAENTVLRCRFLRCQTGLMTDNWNSMDIWVWHSHFADCRRAIHNVMGNWHVWQCLFERSTESDLSIENLMVFSVVNNTSIGSKMFMNFGTGHRWGSPTSVTGNRVIDPTGDWAVKLGNTGPYLIADNQFRLSGSTRGVQMTWGDQVFVGNTYSRSDAVEERGRFRRIADRVVPRDEISAALPALPSTPPNRQRKVFDIVPGAVSGVVQEVIDQAVQHGGERSVIHLSAGRHDVNETIVIPAGCDAQIMGDGSDPLATRLTWTGKQGGMLMRLEGPSRVTLRDIYIDAGRGQGIVIENADQRGGRIFADQLHIAGPGSGKAEGRAMLRIDGLEQTDVQLRALQGAAGASTWVEVVGGPNADAATNQISVFNGASQIGYRQYDVRNGGKLVVRGVYHEGDSPDYQGMLLNDRGSLTMDAMRFSLYGKATPPAVTLENFRGEFAVATSMFTPSEPQNMARVELRGDGSATDALVMGNQFWQYRPSDNPQTIWRNTARPPARGGFIANNLNSKSGEVAPNNYLFLNNVGDDSASMEWKSPTGVEKGTLGVDDVTILRHLAPLREASVWQPGEVPAGATDVSLYRVRIATDGLPCVEIRAH
jgi:hypothetical protein